MRRELWKVFHSSAVSDNVVSLLVVVVVAAAIVAFVIYFGFGSFCVCLGAGTGRTLCATLGST